MSRKQVFFTPDEQAIQTIHTQTAHFTGEGQVSVSIPEAMLKDADESSVLRMTMAIYGMEHPQHSPQKALSTIANIPHTTFSNALSGKGFLGFSAWMAIVDHSGIDLVLKWLYLKHGVQLYVQHRQAPDKKKARKNMSNLRRGSLDDEPM